MHLFLSGSINQVSGNLIPASLSMNLALSFDFSGEAEYFPDSQNFSHFNYFVSITVMIKKNVPMILLALILLNGCSIRKMALTGFTSTLSSQTGDVFTSDDDPELIGDALPFTIKLYESLARKDSTNAELLLATGKLFCLYAQGYVLFEADTLADSLKTAKKAAGKRAKKLFLRGKDYILKGLDLRHPGIYNALSGRSSDSALAITGINDTAYLYWGSVAWTGAILSDRSDLALAMSLKKAVSLMQKVFSLDSSYSDGAVYEFMAIYYASAPKAMGGDVEKSEEFFEKAIELSGEKKASPYVNRASVLSLKKSDSGGFSDFLQKAISIKTPSQSPLRLLNTIYQQKAAWMLANKDRFFPAELTDQ